jgi:putative membrane protein (TIGR04086 family)
MAGASGIHWGRIVAGGLLAEVAILVAVLPFVFIPSGDQILVYAVPPVSLVMTFVFGRWTGNRVDSRFMLHGALAGVVAAVLYIAVTWNQTLPSSYVLAHFLKVIGGAAGGFVAGRTKRVTLDGVPGARVS